MKVRFLSRYKDENDYGVRDAGAEEVRVRRFDDGRFMACGAELPPGHPYRQAVEEYDAAQARQDAIWCADFRARHGWQDGEGYPDPPRIGC